ncbi:MAG: hypothetical protein ACMXX9_02670 [Candidatus Woesearchaeota archaeon]
MVLSLEVIVEIANFLISMFLVLVAYFIFKDSINKGYKIDYMYFLVAAIGFMLFDLVYILSGDLDLATSLRFFVKSSFLGLILFVFMVKSHLLTETKQKPKRKPKPLIKR